MINYIDYNKQEVHISEDASLNWMAHFLDVNYAFLHDFKIIIDGGIDENPNTGEEPPVPIRLG
jgi:hypothetical protein